MKTCIPTLVVAVSICLPGAAAFAACPVCPGEDPDFAFEDVDNDGCYDGMVDVGPIDAMLLAGVYVAPGSSGLVIPKKAKLKGATGVALDWSAENVRISGKPSSDDADLTVNAATTLDLCDKGKMVADASLSVVSGAAAELGAKSKLQAKGGTLSLQSSTSTILIGDKAKVQATGDIAVAADAAISAGEKLKVKTNSPGIVSIQSTNGGVDFGEKLSIKSGGIAIGGDGAVAIPLKAKVETKKNQGESISIISVSDRVDIAEIAKVTADLDLTVAAGTDLELAEGTLLTATNGALSLSAVAGALSAASKQILVAGGAVDLDGQTSVVFDPKQSVVGATASVTSQGPIDLDTMKLAVVDLVVDAAADNVTMFKCLLKPGAATATFSGNVCDITASKFKDVVLDTSGCTSVIGP